MRASERAQVADMNYSLFKFLDDAGLAERIAKLERKVAALKFSTTNIGARMLEEFTAALEAARAEQRRRTC